MEFIRRARISARHDPLRLGILPGSFNPPTIAHLALLEAARSHVDELLCVIPRAFPHKTYHGATLSQRIALLEASGLPAECSIAISERGLFADIAEECRQAYAIGLRPFFVCGRDAAERIVEWDYGREGAIEEMLNQFELLVAPRGGAYAAPGALRHRIHPLAAPREMAEVSSTEVRKRIAQGAQWEDLVAGAIVDAVRKIYT
ncbi:MAG TPA: adenylyltransferase/cytidyltransferase family protein [Bryobacteraceae bacterium]|jgi:cytidyltransferase-like protein|nr:adenylyltransferase/cytidyltransferase family protein [Bryobacteraceae bacterium]